MKAGKTSSALCKLRNPLAGLCLAAALASCGGNGNSNNNNNNSGQVFIDVAGDLRLHPISAVVAQQNATTPDLSAVQFFLADPQDVVLDPDGYVPLVEAEVTCAGDTCTWIGRDVDISQLSIGLLGIVIDPRATPEFITTNSGILGFDQLQDLRANPRLADIGRAVVISLESIDAVAALTTSDPDEQFTAQQMRENGFVFGQVQEDAPPVPIGSLTVTKSRSPGYSKSFYPNADLSGLGSTTADAGPIGTFVVIARTPITVLADFEARDSTDTIIGVQTAGTVPGVALALNFFLDEQPLPP